MEEPQDWNKTNKTLSELLKESLKWRAFTKSTFHPTSMANWTI